MAKLFKNFTSNNDTGFGSSAANQADRLLNKNGGYNVTRTGVSIFNRYSYFHELIAMSWLKFNSLVLATYLVINLFFTLIYWVIGIEHLGGTMGETTLEKFMETFFFSCQTYSTVGYGRINPQGFLSSAIASVESLVGLMSFAVVTGLIYGRFAKPNIRLLTSQNAIIAPFKEGKALMFRITNARQNALLEVEIELMMSFFTHENPVRQFLALKLERKKVNALSLSWTIVHPIDENSPLYGLTLKDYEEIDLELIFMFKAFDESYSQTVHTRTSYVFSEILWGKKFVPMYARSEKGETTILQIEKLNEMVEADLPNELPKNVY
ncbi:MAG: ion channel [Bacteroidota bacterium]